MIFFPAVKVRWIFNGDKFPQSAQNLRLFLGHLALVLRQAKYSGSVLWSSKAWVSWCMVCKEHVKDIRVCHFGSIIANSYQLRVTFYILVGWIGIVDGVNWATVTDDGINNALCAIKITLRAPKSSHRKFGIFVHVLHRRQERARSFRFLLLLCGMKDSRIRYSSISITGEW